VAEEDENGVAEVSEDGDVEGRLLKRLELTTKSSCRRLNITCCTCLLIKYVNKILKFSKLNTGKMIRTSCFQSLIKLKGLTQLHN